MATGNKWDRVIKNVRVVRPHGHAVHEADIAISEGKFAKIGRAIAAKDAKEVYDGKGRLAFPGVVDRSTRMRSPRAARPPRAA
jgi:allantoinase